MTRPGLTPEERAALRVSRKRDYLLYRHIARSLYQNDVRVKEHAPVQIMDDGAFVEAQIWIPEALLAEVKAGRQAAEPDGDVPDSGADPHSIAHEISPRTETVSTPRLSLGEDDD